MVTGAHRGVGVVPAETAGDPSGQPGKPGHGLPRRQEGFHRRVQEGPRPARTSAFSRGSASLGGGCYISHTGLTSIVPYHAAGTVTAAPMASSRSLQSTTKKPAICSLVSANGAVGDHDVAAAPAPDGGGRLGAMQPLAGMQHSALAHLVPEPGERRLPACPLLAADRGALISADQQGATHDLLKAGLVQRRTAGWASGRW
jgi:hypothetical protein